MRAFPRVFPRVAAPLVVLAGLVACTLAAPSAAMAQRAGRPGVARIQGRVLAPNGRPVQNVRVTLQSDSYANLRSVYTDGSGRFQFTAPSGQYYVEVEPGSEPYERKQERLDLNPSPFSNLGEVFFVDVVLNPRSRPGDAPSPNAVVFIQDVPKKARDEFERGKGLLATDKDEAFAAMRRSLQIFPDFYEALETLGSEYVREGHLDHALPILLHAVDVNPDGERSYYALGVLFYQERSYRNAVKAFRRVMRTSPKSANAAVYLGLSHLRNGDTKEAEASLKLASELGAAGIADLHLALAQVYIDSKRYPEAIGELETLLKENPDYKDRAKIQGLIDSLRKKS